MCLVVRWASKPCLIHHWFTLWIGFSEIHFPQSSCAYATYQIFHKSMEHGRYYRHEAWVELVYRFQIVLFNAMHGGIPLWRPRFGIVGSFCWTTLQQSDTFWKRRSILKLQTISFRKYLVSCRSFCLWRIWRWRFNISLYMVNQHSRGFLRLWGSHGHGIPLPTVSSNSQAHTNLKFSKKIMAKLLMSLQNVDISN